MKRIVDFASVFNVKTVPHGAQDLSPVCFVDHMHLNISPSNFGIQEYVGMGNEATQKLFKHEMYLENGMFYVSDKPGLGIEFDEQAAIEYPYKRSYLPVSRLEDGTLWH